MKAFLHVPAQPLQRFLRFKNGLEAAGLRVVYRDFDCQPVEPDDIAVSWNLREEIVARYPRNRILVAENGYLAAANGDKYYALAWGGHNGSGEWPHSDGADGTRFARLERTLAPMRHSGDWVLVCPQRGIGLPPMRMPDGWRDDVVAGLRAVTNRHIEVRKPPSRDKAQPALDWHFDRAWCVVVWTSNVATLALAHGIPVIQEGPAHILRPALGTSIAEIESPPHGDRTVAYNRLGWAQWSLAEIESGAAFRRLLDYRQQRDERTHA